MGTSERFNQLEGRHEVDLQVMHHFGGGTYAKEMHVPAGATIGKHRHSFAHLSVLAAGSALVHTDESTKQFDAPACIEIKAGIHHEITAITDVVWYCIHATDCTDPQQVDTALIGG